MLCLHTAHKIPNGACYLTLSYCWAKRDILKLLQSNEDSFQPDVRVESGPKIFQAKFNLCLEPLIPGLIVFALSSTPEQISCVRLYSWAGYTTIQYTVQ